MAEGSRGGTRAIKSVSTHRVSDLFIDLGSLAIMRMSREAGEFISLRKCAARCVEILKVPDDLRLEQVVRLYKSTDWRGTKAVSVSLTEDEQAAFSLARQGLADRFGGSFTSLDTIVIAMFSYLAVLPGSRL